MYNSRWPGGENGNPGFDLARIDLRGGTRIEDVRRVYKLHRWIERQLEWMGPLAPEKRG
jgi:hypothetical protein